MYEVTRELARRSHEVHIVSGQRGPARLESKGEGPKCHRFPGEVLPHVAAFLFAAKLRPEVIVEDLAHVAPWGLSLVAPRKKGGIAFFHHLHARTLVGQVRPMTASVLRTVEREYPVLYREWTVVTESKSSVDDLRGLGIEEGRVARIEPGVDHTVFKPGERTDQLRLVYFGGMRDYKRPGDALLVLKRVLEEHPRAQLTMIGDGPARPAVELESRRLGLEQKVTFTGRVSDLELSNALGRSWVNLHFSRSEGWGSSVMEAAACGVPTVAYSVPGIRDSISPGRSGTLVPEGDSEAAARAVTDIAQEIDRWSAASSQHAARFTWARCVDGWEALLRGRLEHAGND
jgi:glycosyltransferase involved in cell wall biosynthesis